MTNNVTPITRSRVTLDLRDFDTPAPPPSTSADALDFTPANPDTVDRIAAALALLRYHNDEDRKRANTSNKDTPA